jgi:hypothetical protein
MKNTKSILAGTIITRALAIQGTVSRTQAGSSAETKSVETIRPFQGYIPQAHLDEARRRILATQWPEKRAAFRSLR